MNKLIKLIKLALVGGVWCETAILMVDMGSGDTLGKLSAYGDTRAQLFSDYLAKHYKTRSRFIAFVAATRKEHYLKKREES